MSQEIETGDDGSFSYMPEGKHIVIHQIGLSFVKILMDAKKGITEIYVLIEKRWVKQTPPTST